MFLRVRKHTVDIPDVVPTLLRAGWYVSTNTYETKVLTPLTRLPWWSDQKDVDEDMTACPHSSRISLPPVTSFRKLSGPPLLLRPTANWMFNFSTKNLRQSWCCGWVNKMMNDQLLRQVLLLAVTFIGICCIRAGLVHKEPKLATPTRLFRPPLTSS